MEREKILVVDDEESMRWVFQRDLEKQGYEVHTAADGLEALKLVRQHHYTLIFMDIVIPGMSGLEALEEIRRIDGELCVVVMTAQNTMQNAIAAMKRGAYDYLVKPFDFEQIHLLIDKVRELMALKRKVATLKAELRGRLDVDEIIGQTPCMQEIYKAIGRVAESDATVLIQGESGTGKELVAKALHYHSHRVGNPFVTVNCAAIPRDLLESELFGHEAGAFTGAVGSRPGKFALAHGGTIFLDEIGELDLGLQGKILRVLQDKRFDRLGGREAVKVDVRVIAATNQDLERALEEGRFRRDLYYRLNVVPIVLPPLRERRQDIPLLVEHCLRKFEKEMGLPKKVVAPEAMAYLVQQPWPGNVRELENALKRAMLLFPSPAILAEHLTLERQSPLGGTQPGPQGRVIRGLERELVSQEFLEGKLQETVAKLSALGRGNLYEIIMRRVERPLLQVVLRETKGNQIKAAAILGLNRNTLRKKIRELEIQLPQR